MTLSADLNHLADALTDRIARRDPMHPAQMIIVRNALRDACERAEAMERGVVTPAARIIRIGTHNTPALSLIEGGLGS